MAKTIPELSKWDPEIIKSYMSPELHSEVSDSDLIKMTRIMSKMGTLIATGEPVFKNVISTSTVENGSMTLVTYLVPAKYANGDATLTLILKEKNESFDIYNFNVDSMVLFE